MKPHLCKEGMIMFEKYISKATHYAEFGSGGSTYYTALKNNIIKIYSVESDKEWIEKIKLQLPNNVLYKCNFLFHDIDTISNNWGYPGPNSNINDWIKYNNALNINLNESEKKKIDLILIDGRFRVACLMNCFNFINNDTIVLFDDFTNREYYHIILDFFEIIETGGRMVALKKKCYKQLINNFQIDPR